MFSENIFNFADRDHHQVFHSLTIDATAESLHCWVVNEKMEVALQDNSRKIFYIEGMVHKKSPDTTGLEKLASSARVEG